MRQKFQNSVFKLGRKVVTLAALGVLRAPLVACSVFEKSLPPLPCPQIKIDRDLVQVTQYRDGGTDLTDMISEAEILGYSGECDVDRETNVVDMNIIVSFKASLGPAAAPAGEDGMRKASFDYFIALPDFYPHPAGKQVFTAEIGFPNNMNQVRFRDAQISLRIPLAKDMNSGDAQVFLGMQVTKEQLEFNRRNRPKY